MSVINHIHDDDGDAMACTKCGKRFVCHEEEQTPGFRGEEWLICPYCKEILGSSFEYEYWTERINDEEKE